MASFLLSVAACSTAPTIAVLPTPQSIQLSFTPALGYLTSSFQTCAAGQPELALVVNEVSAEYLSLEDADLILRMGYPGQSESYAALLGQEQLVVIVHPQNPVRSLQGDLLEDLFSGKIKSWEEITDFSATVQPWIYPEGDEVRQAFDAAILGESPLATDSLMAPDPVSMIRGVASNEGAIGYVPASWLTTEETHSVRLDASTQDLLNLPVLALTRSEPQTALRGIIYCLQNKEKDRP